MSIIANTYILVIVNIYLKDYILYYYILYIKYI